MDNNNNNNNIRKCLFFVPALLGTIAWIISSASNFYCENVRFEPIPTIVNETTTTSSRRFENYPTLRFGLYGYKRVSTTFRSPSTSIGNSVATAQNVNGMGGLSAIQQDCKRYHKGIGYDAEWKTARAFAVLGCLLGIVSILFLWITPCGCARWFSQQQQQQSSSSYQRFAWIVFIILLPLFQGLTFLILNSDLCLHNPFFIDHPEIAQFYNIDSCSMGDGSIANIVAIILWVMVGGCMLILGPPPPPQSSTSSMRNTGGVVQSQQVTYQQTTSPKDGITTVAQVNVVKGTYVVPP